MIGFKILSAFIILAILAIASPLHYNPLQVTPSQTYWTELYLQGPRLNPLEHRDTIEGPQFILGVTLAIVALHATISAVPDLNVQIWLVIAGQSTPFFHVNSGSLGTANSDLSGLNIIVPPNTPIILYWWADNLATSQRDFHASITIFYQT